MLTCDLLTEADRLEWQSFASRHPQCGIYHHLGWKDVIESAYGHRAPYLVAKRGGTVCGILPLVLVTSRMFGRSLTSLPFLDFGGVAADDENSHHALLEKARELGREFKVDYIELRQLQPSGGDFQTSTHKVLMTLGLEADEDKLWARLSSERRNRVRRATKSGLSVEVAESSSVPVFYDIWTRNMRDLGSPPHSRLFFEQVCKSFEGQYSILLVRHKERYIGAALTLFWRNTLSIPWVSSLREHFRLSPNDILYWQAMRFAIQRGVGVFDFGRSTEGSGTYQFKQRWGAVPTPLHWQFLSLKGDRRALTAEPGAFSLAVDLWKRVPVPITRMIGPSLRKYITA